MYIESLNYLLLELHNLKDIYFNKFQAKFDGYDLRVHTTDFCPRNQTEWNKKSSALNCTENNGYMCLPNENITQLYEFCYIYPFIWIDKGKRR